MRIVLTKIEKSTDQLLVAFKCDYGFGIAHWLSDSPNVDSEYEVEIDCDDVLKIASNTQETDEITYSISSDGRNTTFVANIDDVYEGGTVALRFGNSIMVAEFDGELPEKGEWYRVTTNRMELINVAL
jgi:hypothetical protein